MEHRLPRRAGLARSLALACALALPAAAASAQHVAPDSPFCGMGPTDWCAAPPGDPCGRHRNATACRADPRCVGMPYRGESVVACQDGERGFSPNCPTVGCRSAPTPPPP